MKRYDIENYVAIEVFNGDWVKYSDVDDEVLQLTSRVAVAEGEVEELKEENKNLRYEMDRFLGAVKQHITSLESKAALSVVINAVKYYESEILKDGE